MSGKTPKILSLWGGGERGSCCDNFYENPDTNFQRNSGQGPYDGAACSTYHQHPLAQNTTQYTYRQQHSSLYVSPLPLLLLVLPLLPLAWLGARCSQAAAGWPAGLARCPADKLLTCGTTCFRLNTVKTSVMEDTPQISKPRPQNPQQTRAFSKLRCQDPKTKRKQQGHSPNF